MDERWISIIIGAVWFIVFFLLIGAMLGAVQKYIDEEIHHKKK